MGGVEVSQPYLEHSCYVVVDLEQEKGPKEQVVLKAEGSKHTSVSTQRLIPLIGLRLRAHGKKYPRLLPTGERAFNPNSGTA